MNLLNINFYAEDTNQGDSILPFLGFWLFIGGILVVLYGAINFFTEYRDFKIFYDSSALKEEPDLELKKKNMKKYGVIIAAGIILVIVSYFF